MGLILQNLFNIKGMSAGQDGILSKDKPADSGQIPQNPQGGSYFGAFGGNADPKGNDPVAPLFRQNHSKYDPSNPCQSFGPDTEIVDRFKTRVNLLLAITTHTSLQSTKVHERAVS